MTSPLAPAVPARSTFSAPSSRTSSLVSPFTPLLSGVVNIDDLDDASSQCSLECGPPKPTMPFHHPLGRTYHANLLLSGLIAHPRPMKVLPKRPSPLYTTPALSTSVLSTASTLVPTPDASFSATSPLITPGKQAPLHFTQSPPPIPASGLFGPACVNRRTSTKRKCMAIAPPISKYKHARTGASPVPMRASLELLVPRNLVHIPPFFSPKARLEAEFHLYGYLSYLYEYACPAPDGESSASLGNSLRAKHSRFSSVSTLRSLGSRSSVATLPKPRARSLSVLSFRRSWTSPRSQDELEISHLLGQIKAERYRVFERVQALKCVIAACGGTYSEKRMRGAKERGRELAKVTLPRILHNGREWGDWVML